MKRYPVLALLLTPLLAAAEPAVVGHYPLSGLVGAAGAKKVVSDDSNGTLWIYGAQSRNLLVVDAIGKKPLKSIDRFNYIYDFALDPARGRVYVSHYTYGYKLTTLDAKTYATLAEHKLGSVHPAALAVDSPANRVYWLSHRWISTDKNYRSALTRWNPETGTTEASLEFETAPSYISHAKLLVGSKKAYLHRIKMTPSGTKTSGKTTYTVYDYQNQILVFSKTTLAREQTMPMAPRVFRAPLHLDETGGKLYAATGNRAHIFSVGASGSLAASATMYCRCYGDIAPVPSQNKLLSADHGGFNVYALDSGKYLGTKEFKGSSIKTVAVDETRGVAYTIDYNRSDVLAADVTQGPSYSTIDIRRDTPSDLALRTGTDELFVAGGQSAGISVWDSANFSEKKFLRSWNFLRGVAMYPKLDKAVVFDGGASANSSFYTYRALNLSTHWWSYPGKTVSGVMGKSKESSTDPLMLVKQYGSYAQYPYRSHLLFFDPETGTETGFAEISYSTDYPRGVAKNPANNRAYVALYGADAVAVIDLAEKTAIKRIPVGKYPEGVAADPIWNRVFVSNYGSDSVSVIDAETDSVIATIPVGKSPRHVAIKKKGTRVYVANEGDDTVTVIHAGSLKVVATVKVQGTPRDIEVDEEKERVYVANFSSASLTIFDDIASGDTQAPVVSHSPFTGTAPDYEDLVLDATVVDDQEVAVVTLTFWSSASANYTTIPMEHQGGSLYRATIPSSEFMKLKGGKVSYFIDATDFEGNGPPTGSNPGTADAPHTFTISRTLEVAWSQAFGKVYGGFYRMIPGPSASVGELRSDRAGLEIATGNEEYYPLGPGTAVPGRWFLFDSKGTVVLTKNTQNDEAHSSTTLYDLDGDGTPEILGGTTSGNQIQAFDGHGNWVWRYTLGSHAISTPAVDELEEGAGPTVFGGSFDKHLRSIDGATGMLNWAFPVSNWIWSSPAVEDLDGDGKKEVLVTSESGSVYVNGAWTWSDGYLYCLDASSGTLRWKKMLPKYKKARTSPALADLDGDGEVEVLYGDGSGVFHALAGSTGVSKWTFTTGGEIYSSAAVGDIDGDGEYEVVFGSNDGFLYALRKDGSLLWKRSLGSEVYASPALARRTPGAGLAVYATTWDGLLYAVDGKSGAVLAGASVEAEVVSSPVVADVDGDGKLEIFFQDRKGNIGWKMEGDVFWAFRDNGSSVGAFAREWPMYRRDPAHTGVYPLEQAADKTPPAYADFRSLDSEANKFEENAYNPLAAGVTVQLTVQDLESGLAHEGYSVRYSSDAGKTWSAAGAALDGPEGSASPQTLTGFGLQLAWTGDTSLCGGESPCAATNQVRFTVKDKAGNTRQAGPFAVRVEEPEAPAAPPAVPKGLTVDSPHMGGRLDISWDANGESDFDAYNLFRDGAFLLKTSSTSVSDEGLIDGTTYTYRLSAASTAGLESERSDPVSGVPADRLPPDSYIVAPTDESVLNETIATISGSASDAGVAGVGKVDVWLRDATDDQAQWLVAQGTDSFQLQLTGLEDGHVYQAASRATDAEGNVEAQLTVVSFSVDLPPSKANTPVLAAHPAGGRLDLAWTANPEKDIDGYKIFRDGKFHAQTSTNAFSDTGLANGQTYAYRVAALDQAGQEGPKSDEAKGVPADALLPVSKIVSPANGAVLFETNASISGTAKDAGNEGLARVRVFVRTGTQAAAGQLAEGTDNFSLALSGLQDFTTYYLVSRAEDAAGNVESTASWTSFYVDLPPAAVTNLSATVLEEGPAATLSWSASPETDLAGYRIYSGTDLIAASTSPAHSLSSLFYGKSYAYAVSAVDARGQEGPKTEVSFATPKIGQASASIVSPKDGKTIWGNAVSLTANASDNTTKISFEFLYETHAAWTVIATDEKKPFSIYWNVSDANVSTGSYKLRAVAFDENGFAEDDPAFITVVVNDANADIVEDGNPDVDPNKSHKITQTIEADQDDTIVVADGTSVTIPKNTVEAGEKIEIETVPPAQTPAPKAPAGSKLLKPGNVFKKMTFASGKSQFANALSVTLPAPDEDKDGVLDGTDIPVQKLKPYYFDEKKNQWVPVASKAGYTLNGLQTAPEAGANGVSFQVDHFTLFGLFQEYRPLKTIVLGEVYCFPNPARAGQSPTFHIEAGAANRAEVRIYDVSGELVHSADIPGPPQVVDDGQGPEQAFEYRWDVSSVGSGVYYYVATAHDNGGGSVRKVGKCSVIK
jgi:YVTN family beta-propeller protein